jgi:hypothetical protein
MSMQVSTAPRAAAGRTPSPFASALVAVCLVAVSALTSTNASAGAAVRVSGGVSFGSNIGSIGVGGLSVGYHRGYRSGARVLHPHHGYGPRYANPRWSIGLWVPLLPIGYATYAWGGAPYYVYDNTYFVSDGRGYRVVKKPNDEATVSPVVDTGPAPVVGAPPKADGSPVPTFEQPARTGQLFAYPRNGQSETAATFDRIECESVGSKQTGFNPTITPVDEAKKAEYTRAVVACLEGRGYSVK